MLAAGIQQGSAGGVQGGFVTCCLQSILLELLVRHREVFFLAHGADQPALVREVADAAKTHELLVAHGTSLVQLRTRLGPSDAAQLHLTDGGALLGADIGQWALKRRHLGGPRLHSKGRQILVKGRANSRPWMTRLIVVTHGQSSSR